MRSLRQPLWRHSSISLETKLRVYQASVLSVLLYGSECWPISTSLCSRLSAFDMQAQRTITNTKWFSSTKQTLKSEHSQTASRFKEISPKVASAVYSGLHQIILYSPSTPSTRGQRDGRDHVEPLARDGVTSSAKI